MVIIGLGEGVSVSHKQELKLISQIAAKIRLAILVLEIKGQTGLNSQAVLTRVQFTAFVAINQAEAHRRV